MTRGANFTRPTAPLSINIHLQVDFSRGKKKAGGKKGIQVWLNGCFALVRVVGAITIQGKRKTATCGWAECAAECAKRAAGAHSFHRSLPGNGTKLISRSLLPRPLSCSLVLLFSLLLSNSQLEYRAHFSIPALCSNYSFVHSLRAPFCQHFSKVKHLLFLPQSDPKAA